MVGAAAMAPWREFWPLALAGPNQPLALRSDTMARLPWQGPIRSAALHSHTIQRLPWEGPLWARLVIYRYNVIPIGKPYNDIGILA